VVVGLFPELDAPGGVQRAGRHLAAVLSEFAGARNMECRLISLNDSPELHRMEIGGREFTFTGCARSKSHFFISALKAARRRAKIVLAAHPHLAGPAQAMCFVAPRMKTIVCAHGMEVSEPLPFLRRRALRRADLILAPSRDTAELVAMKQGVKRNRIRVLPWALDSQFEESLAKAPLTPLPQEFPSGRVILSVGRWDSSERYKGVDHMIAALARIRTRWPEVQLVAVGEGDDRGWLENLAAEHGVRRYVHFLSGLTPAQVAACYAACEIFALPSRGEGFGLVYVEAMASGKPVIAGAHGGAPEVVQDGVTGYLVPHGDVTQLIAALDSLLHEPEQARQMGARGKARIASEFRFQTFAKSLKKILREQCEF
jgi:phosphatidylinositol alpha-1,6-mannosyltransferase